MFVKNDKEMLQIKLSPHFQDLLHAIFSSITSVFTWGGANAFAMNGMEHWAPGKNQAAAAPGATGLCPDAVAHIHGFGSCWCCCIDECPVGGCTEGGIAVRVRLCEGQLWSTSEQLGSEQEDAFWRLASEQATPAILLFHRARYASFSLFAVFTRCAERYESLTLLGVETREVGFQQEVCGAGFVEGVSIFTIGWVRWEIVAVSLHMVGRSNVLPAATLANFAL